MAYRDSTPLSATVAVWPVELEAASLFATKPLLLAFQPVEATDVALATTSVPAFSCAITKELVVAPVSSGFRVPTGVAALDDTGVMATNVPITKAPTNPLDTLLKVFFIIPSLRLFFEKGFPPHPPNYSPF